MIVFNSHTDTRMPSRAALRVFRVGNLLACIFKSILRAVKKPFRASLSAHADVIKYEKNTKVSFRARAD